MLTPQEFKELNQVMWSLGEYARVSKLLEDGARELVEHIDIHRGQEHLDVATGDGNVALLSAHRGALVTGLDLTPQHFDRARLRAREANVSITFIDGDAERLPFQDCQFDVVTSTFGVQFAPRHKYAAREMARVCRPGGVIGLCNWTPRGWTGHFQRIISSYFPMPPPYAGDPMLWGDEEYVSQLLGGDFALHSQLRYLRYEFASPEALISYFEKFFGPCLIAKRAIRPPSNWQSLRDDLISMTTQFWCSDEWGTCVKPEYLLVTAYKRGNCQ